MSNDTQVKQEDREPIESVAEPWICVEERPCEEAVAVHWEEMLTSLTEALATVRREEREAERLRTLKVIQKLPATAAGADAFRKKLVEGLYREAAALEASASDKGEMDD